MRLIAGCGYLGKRVARLWIDQGISVAALTRTKENAQVLGALGIQPIIGDVTDPNSLINIARYGPFEGIFHAVGFDKYSGKTITDVSVHGLANLMNELPYEACPKAVFVSSTSVHAQTDGSWITEMISPTAITGPGGTAIQAESVMRKHLPGSVILRFAGIYGPERLLRSMAIKNGDSIPVDPEKWLNLVHVDDGAKAVDLAWNKAPKGSTLLIADGNPVQRGDFYRTLANLLGAQEPTFRVGLPGGRGGPDASHRRIDSRFARESLGWKLCYPNHEAGLQAILAGEIPLQPNKGFHNS